VTATAYTVCGVVLAGCAAWAWGDRISAAITRARWAWRCRGKPPVRSRVRLEPWEHEELAAIRRGRRKTARPERTRT
jgi:hypothetical protein